MAQNSPQSILPENSSISLPERKKSATKRGRSYREMQSANPNVKLFFPGQGSTTMR